MRDLRGVRRAYRSTRAARLASGPVSTCIPRHGTSLAVHGARTPEISPSQERIERIDPENAESPENPWKEVVEAELHHSVPLRAVWDERGQTASERPRRLLSSSSENRATLFTDRIFECVQPGNGGPAPFIDSSRLVHETRQEQNADGDSDDDGRGGENAWRKGRKHRSEQRDEDGSNCPKGVQLDDGVTPEPGQDSQAQIGSSTRAPEEAAHLRCCRPSSEIRPIVDRSPRKIGGHLRRWSSLHLRFLSSAGRSDRLDRVSDITTQVGQDLAPESVATDTRTPRPRDHPPARPSVALVLEHVIVSVHNAEGISKPTARLASRASNLRLHQLVPSDHRRRCSMSVADDTLQAQRSSTEPRRWTCPSPTVTSA